MSRSVSLGLIALIAIVGLTAFSIVPLLLAAFLVGVIIVATPIAIWAEATFKDFESLLSMFDSSNKGE